MNRAILIILLPALLVAVGYIIVLRSMGLAPSYVRLVGPVALLFGALYWFSRRSARKAQTGQK
jgi:hypothetical protein